MEKQRPLAPDILAPEHRHKTLSIHPLRRPVTFHTRHFQKRREKVLHDNRHILLASGTTHPRPVHNHRFPDSPLQKRTLTARQRSIHVIATRIYISPVIAHEDDDRIFRNTLLIQIIHQIAQALVHPLHNRRILGLRLG